jgi:5'-3' exonuclease
VVAASPADRREERAAVAAPERAVERPPVEAVRRDWPRRRGPAPLEWAASALPAMPPSALRSSGAAATTTATGPLRTSTTPRATAPPMNISSLRLREGTGTLRRENVGMGTVTCIVELLRRTGSLASPSPPPTAAVGLRIDGEEATTIKHRTYSVVAPARRPRLFAVARRAAEHVIGAVIIPGVACDWLLIDGSSLIFRAFYGVPAASVRAPDGTAVNAVRGFLDSLGRLVTQRRPRHLAVASDEAWRPDWRVALIPAYKAHRAAEPVPAGLVPQLPVIHALLDAVGVDVAGVADHEAEDVIATWTALAPGTIEVASGDRDLFALVEDPRVRVLYPERSGLALIDEAEVTRRYGIPGRRYADFAVLRGDPSDGLPGLRGVGAGTAAQLIRRHGGVEEMLRDARLGDADRDYLERAMRVVRPVLDLPVSLPAGRRDRYPADPAALAAQAARSGMESACARLVATLSGMR